MSTEVCPSCVGKCCRDHLGYMRTHLDWEIGHHSCEHCEDGTAPVPVWTAEQERAAVVSWLRACAMDPDAPGAEMRWLQEHASRIERGEHRKEGS